MTGSVLTPPRVDVPPPAVRRAVALEVRDTPDVLVRVLCVLRRRNCVIAGVDFRAADQHRPGRLTVVYEPPPRCRDAVTAWLANLVDVIAVEDARGT
jgi:acetolactate synthase regulatory subunit